MTHENNLTHLIRMTSKFAKESGALQPIRTDRISIIDKGVTFDIHLAQQSQTPFGVESANPNKNPFLPYETDLFIKEVSNSHIMLLNKFPVIPNHVLIVTKKFEQQTSPLNQKDFNSIFTCIRDLDSFIFYNSGSTAGASQSHKHLQLIPRDMVKQSFIDHIDDWLTTITFHRGQVQAWPTFPFKHALTKIDITESDHPGSTPEQLITAYNKLRESLEIKSETGNKKGYNLLLTRQWMMMVPRSQETFCDVSINAMGFAGILLALNDSQLSVLKSNGPLSFLMAVTENTD